MAIIPTATRGPLIVATATTMEMRAAFPTLVGHLPREHGWSRMTLPNVREYRDTPWKDVVLLVTGVGVVNAAFALGRLLGCLASDAPESSPPPAGVLNLGVAGAFSLGQLPLATTVVVSTEIWPEYGLLHDSGIDPKGIGLPQGKIGGQPVWDQLRLSPRQNAQQMGLNISSLPEVIGLTVSGVTGTSERARALQSRYACEIETMEGFALAWACCLAEMPFVQVRTISNLVGSREAVHWDLSGAKQALSTTVRGLLGDIEEALCPIRSHRLCP
ncbi:futalosine hydrolase [Desulfonatronum thioautotrophicum]|uniref:futalosine hydrolase n=1 Tax=Desulfonatronum thioautotrophicum TaxID=617001 RepID=UPI000A0227DE|nr:futalosine hydrolase [Desulfonatronum thioautotrophicum]